MLPVSIVCCQVEISVMDHVCSGAVPSLVCSNVIKQL
jgi:hypothetical protein